MQIFIVNGREFRARNRHERCDGRVEVKCPEHPKSRGSGIIYEHILVMEQKLGRHLVKDEVVHHEDEDTLNNSPNNLKIFKNNATHFLYHLEQKALKTCGNRNWRKCHRCKKYDDPKNLSTREPYYHKACAAAYARERRKYKKELSVKTNSE